MPDAALNAVHQCLISGYAKIGCPLGVLVFLIKPVVQALSAEDGGHGPGQRLVRTAVRDEHAFCRGHRVSGKILR